MDANIDEQRNTKSLARLRGRDRTMYVSAVLLRLFIVLSFLPSAAGWLGTDYMVLMLIVDSSIRYFYLNLYASKTAEEGRRYTRPLYLTLFFFVIAFILSTAV